jgi:hypothetical protein
MALYVDALHDWGWSLGPNCHLTSDVSAEELHRFAQRLGLRRDWASDVRQPKSSVLHYDLVASKRSLAITRGAVALTRREWASKYTTFVRQHRL